MNYVFTIVYFKVSLRIFVIPRNEGSPQAALQKLAILIVEFLVEIPRSRMTMIVVTLFLYVLNLITKIYTVRLRIFVIPRNEGSPQAAPQRLAILIVEFLVEIPRSSG